MNLKNQSLPEFFIVGAQKSASTTIHNWLMQNDEVNLPLVKETHFFSDINMYKNGIDWYLKKFENNTKIKAEIDPSYLYIEESIDRMKEIYKSKQPKFIISLRSPIQRAYSHFLMSKYKGYENLSFLDAIKAEKYRITDSNKKHTLTKDLIAYSYMLLMNIKII